MNKILMIGNICRDIEVNHYNDRKVVKNTIAVRRDFKNKNGEYDSDFFNFSVWGNQAEYVSNYAKKGDKIAICGKLLNNNYERDGQTIYSNDIQIENIEILTPRQSTDKKMDAEVVNKKLENIGVGVEFLD
jgi:single-strand DNA-binding protein